MLIKQALVMEIGMTHNGLEITKEMILNSLDSFLLKPIVLNKNEQFKDYTDTENVSQFVEQNAIGFIADNIKVENNKIYADIVIEDDYKDLWKGKYDNWCIQLYEDKKSFELCSLECF